MSFKIHSMYQDPSKPDKTRVVFRGDDGSFIVTKMEDGRHTLKFWKGADLDKTVQYWTTKPVANDASVIKSHTEAGNSMLTDLGASTRLEGVDSPKPEPTKEKETEKTTDAAASKPTDPSVVAAAKNEIAKTAIGSAGRPVPASGFGDLDGESEATIKTRKALNDQIKAATW